MQGRFDMEGQEENKFSIADLFKKLKLDINKIEDLTAVEFSTRYSCPEIAKQINEIIELRMELNKLKGEES
jgi:hypothetical protein